MVVVDPPSQSWPEQLRRDLRDIAVQEKERNHVQQHSATGEHIDSSPYEEREAGGRPNKLLGASGGAALSLGLSPESRPTAETDRLHPVWDPPGGGGVGGMTVLSVTPGHGRDSAMKQVPLSARSAGGVAFEVPSGQQVSLQGAADHLEKRARAWNDRSATKGATAARG